MVGLVRLEGVNAMMKRVIKCGRRRGRGYYYEEKDVSTLICLGSDEVRSLRVGDDWTVCDDGEIKQVKVTGIEKYRDFEEMLLVNGVFAFFAEMDIEQALERLKEMFSAEGDEEVYSITAKKIVRPWSMV